MKCLLCKGLLGPIGKKFCSRSCSVSYNNSIAPKRVRTSTRLETKCLHCKAKFIFRPVNSNGKYCSSVCNGEHRKNLTRKAISKGTNVTLRGMRNFLAETFGEVCSICGIGPTWNKQPLTLQLDHIDGNSDNNHRKNMRLLCPNCHTQTPTFGCKGKGNRYQKDTKRNRALREYKARSS